MNVIVTDSGFQSDDWTHGFTSLEDFPANDQAPAMAVDLEPDSSLEVLRGRLDSIDLIRIHFHSFADGRGFSLATTLRHLGFAGRLRAVGHVLADQYAMARRCGFDEVEISDDLAARQPENQWLARANWRAHDYQSRLRAVSG
ncbi:DUF934 domain-containing protein [Parasulfitobacter algicola]|uniref:DUF934 domain-containing protein n=1 Tax=Parasulfitobacter algicola TaxID=2614809 RepID=A0ABX2ISS3_9RHOB|nr:DUF934 domain-containing protein [Sulfitobacter algicola]NSX55605.1 DUF934 domain-containing protein [Sulfitobacter algicola]